MAANLNFVSIPNTYTPYTYPIHIPYTHVSTPHTYTTYTYSHVKDIVTCHSVI